MTTEKEIDERVGEGLNTNSSTYPRPRLHWRMMTGHGHQMRGLNRSHLQLCCLFYRDEATMRCAFQWLATEHHA
jgi:hypothetical protein